MFATPKQSRSQSKLKRNNAFSVIHLPSDIYDELVLSNSVLGSGA